MKKSGNKRGQITIFVIIGIIILALAFAIYYFYPQIKSTITGQTMNPSSYLQNCIEEDLNLALKRVSAQGGSINPEHYLLYQNQKLEYLCYTNEYYKTCVMQQPLLKRHVEQEVTKAISDRADECLASLEQTYTKSGYEVDLRKGKIGLELLPKRVVIYFNSTLTLKKDTSQRYTDIRASVTNNLYELVSIATSILNFETTYGDSETTIYMNYYHDLKVEKIKQEEGSKVYILTDRNNGNKFQFATRSLAWPPGV
ncbi:MAG: hypothetical protein V1788_02300 [Nanoarchaeota archaeon]